MRLALAVVGITLLVLAAIVVPCLLQAGEVSQPSGFSLLDPIRSGNLTVFPVVANKSYDTAQFLTLDEGIRSGDVVVTEAGQAQGLIRRRPGYRLTPYPIRDNAVNQLVLINNSNRPLLLLAGEIVTDGKQDRVIGKDRIVPAESDPVDLSVFCVEPGRWTAAAGKPNFDNTASGGMAVLASPAVRATASRCPAPTKPRSRPPACDATDGHGYRNAVPGAAPARRSPTVPLFMRLVLVLKDIGEKEREPDRRDIAS